ncbi:hypothetical protein G5I_00228 [Acromyrmex echinatior]|uniref:Uncharacterized protein n=1 Tax=Acromyrmex echinatior TaxID=103372 RepID=F4W4B2_ACREC|nr:hypothetical protein G5I_00228 [Acromyrmex echinatior]
MENSADVILVSSCLVGKVRSIDCHVTVTATQILKGEIGQCDSIRDWLCHDVVKSNGRLKEANAHFSPDMWEAYPDSKPRCLKANAVSTIFKHMNALAATVIDTIEDSQEPYQEDNREYLSEFLNIIQNRTSNTHDTIRPAIRTEIYNYCKTRTITLNNIDINKLHYITDYLIMNIFKNKNAKHVFVIGNKNANFYYYSTLTRIRARQNNILFFIKATLCFFHSNRDKISNISRIYEQSQRKRQLKETFYGNPRYTIHSSTLSQFEN